MKIEWEERFYNRYKKMVERFFLFVIAVFFIFLGLKIYSYFFIPASVQYTFPAEQSVYIWETTDGYDVQGRYEIVFPSLCEANKNRLLASEFKKKLNDFVTSRAKVEIESCFIGKKNIFTEIGFVPPEHIEIRLSLWLKKTAATGSEKIFSVVCMDKSL